jgi:hypothetical protein
MCQVFWLWLYRGAAVAVCCCCYRYGVQGEVSDNWGRKANGLVGLTVKVEQPRLGEEATFGLQNFDGELVLL